MRPSIQLASYLIALMTIVLTGCASSGNDVSISDQQKEQTAVASSDHLIVAGQRIGPVRLGMFRDDLLETLGQPNEEQTLNYTSGREKWTYTRLNLIVYISSGSAPAVDEITTICWLNGREGNIRDAEWSDVDPPNTVFQTPEGFKLGSTSFDIRRKYNDYPQEAVSGFIMDFKRDGIQFMVTREQEPRVVRIAVEAPQLDYVPNLR